MIGDLFGNIGEQQEQLKAQLDKIEISETSLNGEITVQLTAAKTILDISIDSEKIDFSDPDQLEDLLVISLNKALDKATMIAADETQKLVSNMLPPGFGNMFKS